MIEYLSKEQILFIHEKIIESFSKENGGLNIGNLEATLERIEGYKGENEEALFWKATILMERIIAGHPFIDGNKRTAYEATRVFPESNGHRLCAGEDEVIGLLVGIAKSEKNRFAIKSWLEKHSKKSLK